LITVLTLQKLSCTLLFTASTTEMLAHWRLSSWPFRVAHSASLAANCYFISYKSLFVVCMVFAFLLAWFDSQSASCFFCSARNASYGSTLVTGLSWEWRHCYKTQWNPQCKTPRRKSTQEEVISWDESLRYSCMVCLTKVTGHFENASTVSTF